VYLSVHTEKNEEEGAQQKVVALKCWQKSQVLQENQLKSILSEKSILEELKFPFVTELFGSL